MKKVTVRLLNGEEHVFENVEVDEDTKLDAYALRKGIEPVFFTKKAELALFVVEEAS
jgi:hypothetical protein